MTNSGEVVCLISGVRQSARCACKETQLNTVSLSKYCLSTKATICNNKALSLKILSVITQRERILKQSIIYTSIKLNLFPII